MILTIQSGEPISDEMIDKIRGIFRESKCPNESLRKTFYAFTWLRDNVIQFGEGENFVEYIKV